MSFWDHFRPNPPIDCPRCGGVLTGWQGRHSGDACFFIWEQGLKAPVGQLVDEDFKARASRLAQMRLGPDSYIDGGSCDTCGFDADSVPIVLNAVLERGTWVRTDIEPRPIPSQLILDTWVQCLRCFSAWPERPGARLYICDSCRGLVEAPPLPPAN